MRVHNHLLPRQSATCVVCPAPPLCNCAPNQQCFQINRDCNTCSSIRCVNQQGISSKAGSGGVSTGALVGAVIGSLVFVAAAVALFFWYRRRIRQEKTDVPAPASTVLNRPDPTEKSLTPATEPGTLQDYINISKATTDLDPDPTSVLETVAYTPSQVLTQINPFDDGHSIQTTGTDGTNVIPIAFVPPGSPRSQETLLPTSPTRPARSPDLNLNLDHVNVSRDSLRATSRHSQVSGVSGISARQSYMSGASYASDFLNEAPMIIPTKGAIRQVLGVVKAEVIKTPSAPSTPSHSETLKPPKPTRPSVGSPLASGSFGPADMARDSMYEQELSVSGNPFGDDHSPQPSSGTLSNTADNILSRLSRPDYHPTDMEWAAEGPRLPWAQSDDFSRPSSLSTQAGSVVDIGSATRVNVGLGSGYSMNDTPLSSGFPRSPYRTTMGRLVSPPTNGMTSSLEAQQQLALAHAQARAQAQGLDNDRRVSGSSVLSGTSTRADSILESFPFVPPSPISDRPIRSPPCSPLAQQSFNGRQSPKEAPRSNPLQGDLPPPPNIRILSTGSQLSTSSTGLGSFPFQIESATVQETAAPPPAFKGRHRASLDTLALTSDLSSYPLGFEQDLRDSFAASQKN